jgi:superfamily II DNA/RNA helicase
MSHHVLVVHPADKHQVAASIGAREGRTVMFVRTQLGAERLANTLLESGVVAGALHGGMHQGERNRTIGDFRDGRVPVLVATDVAARGIHVDDVSLVVHVDPAADPKDYLHRSGRTARAGGTGTVVTLAMPRQQREVASLTQRAGVAAAAVRVRPGDHGLAEITGARQPSGVPVTRPAAPARGRHEHRGHGRPGSGRPQGRGVTRRTAP